MRVKLQSIAPLPEIRTWFAINANERHHGSIDQLKLTIKEQFDISGDISLTIQEFPLPTQGKVFEYIQSDDLITFFSI
jgi:hypothetical protein